MELGGGEREDVADGVVEGVNGAVDQTGFAHGLHLVEAVVGGDGELSYQLPLCLTQLGRGEWLGGKAAQLGLDQLERALPRVAVDAGIYAEETGIGEEGVLRLDGVAEAVTLTHGHIESRVHGRTAEDVVEQGEGGAALVVEAGGGTSKDEVGLMGVA